MKPNKNEVKLYGGIEKKVKSPTGYGDELAYTPDSAMTGTISEDISSLEWNKEFKVGDIVKMTGSLSDKEAIGKITKVTTDSIWLDTNKGGGPYGSLSWSAEHYNPLTTEDIGTTTADMAVCDTRVGTMKKNKQKPAYGYSYMTEDLDKKIANLKKAIAGYYDRKKETVKGSTEHKICVKRIIDCESDLGRLEKELEKKKKSVKESLDPVSPKVKSSIEAFKTRPDFEKIMSEFRNICREYGIVPGTSDSIGDQVRKKNPIYQKEFVEKLDNLNKKYNLSLKSLGLEEDDNFDFAAEERNYYNVTDYKELRNDILTDYELIIDSGVDKDTAIGQTAARYKQDPQYVRALVKEQTSKLKKEIMTEKEEKTRRLLESYGVITKSKAPIEETEEEEEETEETDEKEEKEDKKDSKKGKNPFPKKDSKEDSEEETEEEESEEEEGGEEFEFTGAGSEVCVKGLDRETAKGLAAKLLAPFERSVEAPVGKYTITFEPSEEEETEE